MDAPSVSEQPEGISPSHLLERLKSEARALRYLLDRYLDDKYAERGDGKHGRDRQESDGFSPPRLKRQRLIYFVDAHEISCYINPMVPSTLNGFLFDAERTAFDDDQERVEVRAKLANNLILDDLLFVQPEPVVLLPPYGEEVSETIAHAKLNWLQTEIRLHDAARREAEEIRDRTFSYQMIQKAVETGNFETSPDKNQLVRYLTEKAPALMALMRPQGETPRSRIGKLVDRSRLIQLDELPWEEYGFSKVECNRLRRLRPDPDMVTGWRMYLEKSPRRSASSSRANRIDAEAVAYLQMFNRMMGEMTRPAQGGTQARARPHVQARLVTRAMALINAVRDDKRTWEEKLHAADFLRHPRLLLMGGDRVQDRTWEAERALDLALKAFLGNLFSETETPALQTKLTVAAQTLIAAWQGFEEARYAFGLRSSDGAQFNQSYMERSKYKELLSWFLTNESIETLVIDNLRDDIKSFNSRAFELGSARSDKDVRAQLLDSPNHPRMRRLIPLGATLPGPVEFPASLLRESDTRIVSLREVLRDLDTFVPGEQYLAWALIHACNERWNLAATYADSAILSQNLYAPRSGQRWIADEARLIRAQIKRLSGIYDRKLDDRRGEEALTAERLEQRFESVRQDLASIKLASDPRVLRERAAQILELQLTAVAHDPAMRVAPPLSQGFRDVVAALGAEGADAILTVRILALGISYAFAVRKWPQLWQGDAAEVEATGGRWHRDLHDALANLRRDGVAVEDVSPVACAIEVLGFQLFDDGADAAPPALRIADGIPVSLPDPRPGTAPLRIPQELRLSFIERDIAGQVERRTDRVASMLTQLLKPIQERLESNRQFNLIYTPIWTHDGSETIVKGIPDRDAARHAADGYELLRKVTAYLQLQLSEEKRSYLNRAIWHFGAAGELLAQDGSPAAARKSLFFLRMEACYARLLLNRSNGNREEQEREYHSLIDQYRSIARDYPEASIPHFRLSTILSALERLKKAVKGAATDASLADAINGLRQEALQAITFAVDLVGKDPFLLTENLWVRSTMQRRLTLFFADEAEKYREALKEDPSNTELQERYVEQLLRAFDHIYRGFDGTSATPFHRLFETETRRRINNIVYRASLYLDAQAGDWRALGKLGFSREEMRSLLERLHPQGIEHVAERNIAHTIGCGYFVLGDADNARAAGGRFFQLLSEERANSQDEEIARLLNDAFRWMREGALVAGEGATR